MKRGNNRAKIESLLQTMRDRIPGLVLRTTFLVGFPGETDEQYDELRDFVQDFRFDRMGCFAFSREKGTKSDGMDGQVPEEVKIQRRDELMAVQQEIAYENNRARVGTTCDVMVDGYDEVGEHYIGRSYGDAPEIDGCVQLLAPQKASKTLRVGEFTQARIVGTQGHDLVGLPV
jgi:ribosomal protein S12 methylthiotransferase